jgi:hypothetical protein
MVYHRFPQLHAGGVMVAATEFAALSGFLPADARMLSRYRAHQTSCLAFRRSILQEIFPIPESMRIQADAYPELIAVLLTQVLALDEDLAVYRIHGGNLCVGDYRADSAETASRLVVSSNTVRSEVQGWIRTHRGRTGNVNTRRLLDGLVLTAIEQQFRFEPPSRIRYFAFLLRQNYANGPTQGWRLTTVKYVAPLVALLLGFKKSRLVHGWCGKALNALRPAAGR